MKQVGFLICMLFTFACSGQRLSVGIGAAINQTRLRQNAPTIEVDFSNPHKAGIGLSIYEVTSLKFGRRYSANLRPGLSILTIRSDVTSDQIFGLFDLSAELGYAVNNRLFVNAGAEYGHLIRWLSRYRGPYRDWTFFANRRHFIYPVMSLGYRVDDRSRMHIRFEYFLKDVFNSGALDHDGNIVGPVMVYPFTIEIGGTYSIEVNKALKKKSRSS